MANSNLGRGDSLRNFLPRREVQRVSDQNNWLVEGQRNVHKHTHTLTPTVQSLDVHQAELIFVIFNSNVPNEDLRRHSF